MRERLPSLKFLIFAAVCIVAGGWLIQVTGNLRFFSDTVDYEAVLNDATGLRSSDSVLLAGVRVGTVQAVGLERGKAVVTFSADRDLEIRDTWEVGVRWRNVLGQRYLYLYAVGDGAPLEPGDRLPVEQSRPEADIGRFFNELTPLLRAIDPEQQNILLTALNEALDGKEERIQDLVADLGALSSTLADREPQIRSLITEATALLEAYNARDAEIRAFLDDLADVSTTLAARNDELIGAVTDIAEVQQHFGELLEANDAEIRAITDQLEVTLSTIGRNRDDLERAVASSREGLAVYLLISRWGQWFNIRSVAVQVQDDGQVIYCQTEANEPCSEPSVDPGSNSATSSRAPARLDGLSAVVGTALGEGPGSGLSYAADRPDMTGEGS